ncbi:unnamed protein product [Gongylonema pulchrum]|uniref:Uncharacterized protein n=1 Tax=Gongylonema pulchrum TaxID=637853 RepID=A0A183DNF5_9BILA|nr:unnamed protein product [Gongylonema pulchrum]
MSFSLIHFYILACILFLRNDYNRLAVLWISAVDGLLFQVYFIDSYRMFIDLEKKLHDELRTAVRLLDWGRC